jgi:hypothetical protein
MAFSVSQHIHTEAEHHIPLCLFLSSNSTNIYNFFVYFVQGNGSGRSSYAACAGKQNHLQVVNCDSLAESNR